MYEENLETLISNKLGRGEFVHHLVQDKSGKLIRLIITSPKSASLPSSLLIPAIKFKDSEQGISIEYKGNIHHLYWIDQLGAKVVITIPKDPENYFFLLLEGIHFQPILPKEIYLENITPDRAHRIISVLLDSTSLDRVKEGTMGVEGEPISHPEELTTTKTPEQLRMELAQKFTYEDASQIPPGVNPQQLDFLHEAASVGGFEWVKEYTAEMITKYFTSDATQIDLGKEYGITKQAVQERIATGMSKMRRVLYRDKPEFAKEDKYPLEQIQKGKDEAEIRKTEKYKKKLSKSIKDGLRKPGSEKIKKPVIEVFNTEPDEH